MKKARKLTRQTQTNLQIEQMKQQRLMLFRDMLKLRSVLINFASGVNWVVKEGLYLWHGDVNPQELAHVGMVEVFGKDYAKPIEGLDKPREELIKVVSK